MNAGDDELRRRLSAAARQVPVQVVAPAALRPRMRRARRVRRATVGATVAVLVGGGTAAGLQLAGQIGSQHEIRTLSTAGQADGSSGSLPAPPVDATGPPVVTSTEPTASAPPAATVTVESTDPPSTIDPATTVAAPTVTPSVAPTTVPPLPATTAVSAAPSTTTQPATTVEPTRTTRIESACGVVIVAVAGNATRLEGTEPLAGFGVDVKNDGPEQVEVGFASGDDECEVKAWVAQGVLQTFVDNHDEP